MPCPQFLLWYPFTFIFQRRDIKRWSRPDTCAVNGSCHRVFNTHFEKKQLIIIGIARRSCGVEARWFILWLFPAKDGEMVFEECGWTKVAMIAHAPFPKCPFSFEMQNSLCHLQSCLSDDHGGTLIKFRGRSSKLDLLCINNQSGDWTTKASPVLYHLVGFYNNVPPPP